MQLIVTTPSGIALAISVQLTGNIAQLAGSVGNWQLAAIEVQVTAACSRYRTIGTEDLPGPAASLKYLWVKPADLCDDSTVPFKHEELLEMAERVRMRMKSAAMRGSLGASRL